MNHPRVDAQLCGFTAAHKAVAHNNVEALRALVDDPRVDLDSRDYRGHTPLHHAAQRACVEVTRLLLESGRVEVNSLYADKNGHTSSALVGVGTTARLLQTTTDVVLTRYLLLKHGASPHVTVVMSPRKVERAHRTYRFATCPLYKSQNCHYSIKRVMLLLAMLRMNRRFPVELLRRMDALLYATE